MSRSDEIPFQEDHAYRRHQPSADIVLPARVRADAREHSTRLPQGVVRAVLRLLLCLRVWIR